MNLHAVLHLLGQVLLLLALFLLVPYKFDQAPLEVCVATVQKQIQPRYFGRA